MGNEITSGSLPDVIEGEKSHSKKGIKENWLIDNIYE